MKNARFLIEGSKNSSRLQDKTHTLDGAIALAKTMDSAVVLAIYPSTQHGYANNGYNKGAFKPVWRSTPEARCSFDGITGNYHP